MGHSRVATERLNPDEIDAARAFLDKRGLAAAQRVSMLSAVSLLKALVGLPISEQTARRVRSRLVAPPPELASEPAARPSAAALARTPAAALALIRAGRGRI